MAKTKLNIFLSASIPLEERDKKYFETADVIAIRDSVIALASVAIPQFNLIWGGHPSITPLIANILKHNDLNVQESVVLYQSLFFEKFFPLENESVAKIIKTKSFDNRDDSLLEMRTRMLSDNRFCAGVFIGGMDGVEKEYKLFRKYNPDAIVMPIASTGAAAKIIFDDNKDKLCDRLENDLLYESLYRDFLNI